VSRTPWSGRNGFLQPRPFPLHETVGTGPKWNWIRPGLDWTGPDRYGILRQVTSRDGIRADLVVGRNCCDLCLYYRLLLGKSLVAGVTCCSHARRLPFCVPAQIINYNWKQSVPCSSTWVRRQGQTLGIHAAVLGANSCYDAAAVLAVLCYAVVLALLQGGELSSCRSINFIQGQSIQLSFPDLYPCHAVITFSPCFVPAPTAFAGCLRLPDSASSLDGVSDCDSASSLDGFRESVPSSDGMHDRVI
jgi:uncharacterized membrane protein